MPKLLDLPPELFSHIASVLAEPEDRSLSYENGQGPLYHIPGQNMYALTAFGQTCQRALEAVQPHFFRHLSLDLRNGNGPLIDLLMTWEAQPELAICLRTLRVSLSQNAQHCAPLTREEASVLSAVAKRLGVRFSGPVPIWAMSGFLLALVVLQARHIQVLDIQAGARDDFPPSIEAIIRREPFSQGEQYPFHLFPSAAETTVRLHHLRRFRCYCSSRDARSVMLSEVCKVLNLAPNIDTVELTKVRDDEPEVNWSSVTSLSLTSIVAEPSRITRMIKSCKALREFKFDAGGVDRETTPSQILGALAKHSSTIRTLSIQCMRLPDAERLGSLASLGRLQKLMIRRWDLRRDVLLSAPWLQTLHILPFDMGNERDREVIDWFAGEVKKGSFPQFREMILSHFACGDDPEGRHGHSLQCSYGLRGDVTLESLERSAREPLRSTLGLLLEDAENKVCPTAAFVRKVFTTLIKAGVTCKLHDHARFEWAAAAQRGEDDAGSVSEFDRDSSDGIPEDVAFWRGDGEDGGGDVDGNQAATGEGNNGGVQDEEDQEEMDDADDDEYEYF
ncbi:hypothetical protein CkaCkLH20_02122 [Colletotrichum karsti]|uniref:F-box domain-containing protein n=1 Tax=Colletotrichum karsti TaxID=1095194 RepID=A0A9P6LNP9_9PEZI|nr:uncharacterized protein CkaCkLH20_02122 [Colletotrichum karsti]KAF9880168.1 hypothetical protein CkaCkLH20_02122 [Colletotrichum karsti]